jgi:uncharacterized membrane protein
MAVTVTAGLLVTVPPLPLWAMLAVPVAALPAYVDGVAQYQYGRESNNPRRFLTGLALGVAIVVLRSTTGLSG